MEYAVVTAGLLALFIALGALRRSLGSGLFVQHALMSASHHLEGSVLGSIADIFLY